jgi:hypothetical protein
MRGTIVLVNLLYNVPAALLLIAAVVIVIAVFGGGQLLSPRAVQQPGFRGSPPLFEERLKPRQVLLILFVECLLLAEIG